MVRPPRDPSAPDPLLDPPAGAPAWLPRIDDERSMTWLRRGVMAALLAGALAFVVRGADRPADPSTFAIAGRQPAPQGAAPPGTPPGIPDRRPLEGFGEIAIAVTDSKGAVTGWCMLLADRRAQHLRGLMEVTDLGGYPGMVFRYSRERTNSFYMRNTPMPLSIAWFRANGRLVSRADMLPCDDVDDCPRYPPKAAYRYAVEVPRGHLDELGIERGSTLRVGGRCAPRSS